MPYTFTARAGSPHFDPPHVTIGSRETVTLRFDMRALLTAGQAIASSTAALWDVSNNTTYGSGLPSTASTTGDYIDQAVAGLVSGRTYRLMIGMSPGDTRLFNDLLISVPEGWS